MKPLSWARGTPTAVLCLPCQGEAGPAGAPSTRALEPGFLPEQEPVGAEGPEQDAGEEGQSPGSGKASWPRDPSPTASLTRRSLQALVSRRCADENNDQESKMLASRHRTRMVNNMSFFLWR